MSAITLTVQAPTSYRDTQCFVPGMIYGGSSHLSDTSFGGKAFCRGGAFDLRIREDRLPAPLFVVRFKDGTFVSVLNPEPTTQTVASDALDCDADHVLTDERLRFGAVGLTERGPKLSLGYWYPGTEGETTYRGDTYPGGQMHKWRRRFHPIKDGLTQEYRVEFHFGEASSLPALVKRTWRYVWDTLEPALVPHDIETVRQAVTEMLTERIIDCGHGAGWPNFINTENHSCPK